MIDIDEIAKVVHAYLDRNGGERPHLSPLLASFDQRTAITDRATFTGHITCSAVLINPQGRILHIRHNSLGIWLRPGGHVEPTDLSVHDAALRELAEETGIPASVPRPLGDLLPIDIDVHTIPANAAKNEPEHRHYDLRFGFTVPNTPSLTLQVEEVNAFDWLTADQIQPDTLRRKVQTLL